MIYFSNWQFVYCSEKQSLIWMFKTKQLHIEEQRCFVHLCREWLCVAKSDMTFQLQAVVQYMRESATRLFNSVLFPYLGCWDGNGNDAPAAASFPVAHLAWSSALAGLEALRRLHVHGRTWELEAPCHGDPPLDHWAWIEEACLGCCWPHSYWGSSHTADLKWLPQYLWCSEGHKHTNLIV